MTGSIALDVVIGLVFIYLLYSLLATILCEIIALHLGLRARNLQQAIRRMLEDSAATSEFKLVAFFKNVWQSIENLFVNKDGPGACVFYHLPVIKYLGRNTYYSKPSYITRQNFAKGMMEIFRRYGGNDGTTDLERIQKVLSGALEHPGVLGEIKNKINEETKKETKIDLPPQPEHGDSATSKAPKKIDYVAIKTFIEEKIKAADASRGLDDAQVKLLYKIKNILKLKDEKEAVYKIDELLNLFGHETRSHLASLLRDANNDLVKFRLHLEQWFDDTMDRATGWYKQKIQFVLLMIGFTLAVLFNANTLHIVKKLSVDTDARDKLASMATNYVSDPTNKLPESIKVLTTKDSALIDSLKKERLEELKKVQQKLQKEMDEANSLLGMGWVDLPDSLELLPLDKEDSLKKLSQENLVQYTKIKIDTTSKDSLMLLVHTGYERGGILSCLTEKNSFAFQENIYQRFKRREIIKKVKLQTGPTKTAITSLPSQEAKTSRKNQNTADQVDTTKSEKTVITKKIETKIWVDNGFTGDLEYFLGNLFSKNFWGFLLTALAISLGAPFWFDMLNKLVQIRGAVKEPTQAQAASGSTKTTTDPSHTLNRKG